MKALLTALILSDPYWVLRQSPHQIYKWSNHLYTQDNKEKTTPHSRLDSWSAFRESILSRLEAKMKNPDPFYGIIDNSLRFVALEISYTKDFIGKVASKLSQARFVPQEHMSTTFCF